MICNPNVFFIIMIIIIAVYNRLFVNLTPSKSNFKYAKIKCCQKVKDSKQYGPSNLTISSTTRRQF